MMRDEQARRDAAQASVQMAAHAQQLLDNPAFAEAVKSIRARAMDMLLGGYQTYEDEGRKIAWHEVRVIDMIAAALAGMIKKGSDAEAMMRDLDESRERLMNGRR